MDKNNFKKMYKMKRLFGRCKEREAFQKVLMIDGRIIDYWPRFGLFRPTDAKCNAHNFAYFRQHTSRWGFEARVRCRQGYGMPHYLT